MAHPCPECGLTCYCGGDIDDCCFENTCEHILCKHCYGKDDEDYDEPMNEHEDGYNLKSLKGRSLPSNKYGAWIVDQVSETISGRSRLVTADLKGEQWVWTSRLVEMFAQIDGLENGAEARTAPELGR